MAAPRRVRVGELDDDDERRPAREDGVQVHLLEGLAPVLETALRDRLEPIEQGLGLRAAVRLDDTDHDIGALSPLLPRGLQHRIGLADAGRGTDEDLEPAPLLASGLCLQRLRRRPALGLRHGPSISHRGETASSARFSRSTFTRGSPRMPSCRPSVYRSTSASTSAREMPRTRATRAAW